LGFLLHSKNSTIVEVYENGILKFTLQANIYRRDLVEKDIHPTGMCGFNIEIDASEAQLSGEIVIKVKDDIVPLTNGTNNV
jgi:hypothetical protein